MKVNEHSDLATALTLAQGSFLCGKPSGGCLECHPSCQGDCDSDQKCKACAASDAVAVSSQDVCVCDALNGGVNYHKSCGTCDTTCATCFNSQDSDSCRTCQRGSTPIILLLGACQCTSPGVVIPKSNPNSLPLYCSHCSGCDFCSSPDPAECFVSQEQVDFVKYTKTAYNLPLTIETADHLLCYFHPRLQWDTSGCTTKPYQAVVTETIKNYDIESKAAPTVFQCYELLRATWPHVTHWFTTLFTDFQGPAGATDAEKLAIKSTIYLWILRFGVSTMKGQDWADLRAALKAGSSAWVNYLGWLGATPGFTTNAANPAKPFPSDLLTHLKSASGCGGVTAGCKDLQVFNLKSTVCANASCTVQTQCKEVASVSECARRKA